MKIIKQSYEIVAINASVQLIEKIGRVCYKSEDKITKDSALKFVNGIIKSGHESVLEHGSMTVRFITDRAVTHELVRHRLMSISQESQRYCNYSADKFDNGVSFILPVWLYETGYIGKGGPDEALEALNGVTAFRVWKNACEHAEREYLALINEHGWSAQKARTVLPNSCKTEIVATANFREWRHVFKLRCAKDAYPQMRELMIPCLIESAHAIIGIFDDIFAQYVDGEL